MILLLATLTVMQQEPDQEQRIARRDLPAAVARTYEGHVITNGKWSEVKVGPDGQQQH